MNIQPALAELMESRGVRFAALLNNTGVVEASVGADSQQAAGLIVPANAIVQTLQQTLEADGWDDLVLDVEGGPILLTPTAKNQTLAVGFDELSGLGRVRLAVQRSLSAL